MQLGRESRCAGLADHAQALMSAHSKKASLLLLFALSLLAAGAARPSSWCPSTHRSAPRLVDQLLTLVRMATKLTTKTNRRQPTAAQWHAALVRF